jgi:CubicO group peptidase (beta-lactamase class C family)
MDQLLERFAKTTVPGCSCTIMKENEVVYEGHAGMADIESKTTLTKHSMYRQASTTKLFTYAIIGMLYEEGKFLFTDPISEYLPEWKTSTKAVKRQDGSYEILPTEKPISIKDAVTMTCGLPYCMFAVKDAEDPTIAQMSLRMEKLSKSGVPTLREEVRAMADVPLRFEPGSHWLYGFGSEITGAIVEILEGKALREVFRERLIEPLGLKDCDTYLNEAVAKKLVSNYMKAPDGKLTKTPKEADNGIDPDYTPIGARASLLSSSTDYAIFMQMLANGGIYKGHRFLSKGTVEMLTANYLNETQLKDFNCDYLSGYGYGYGFRTLMDKAAGNHNGPIGAFGWTGGSGIWAEADPVNKVSIAYMHNMMPNEELYHHHRVRSVAYGCMDN